MEQMMSPTIGALALALSKAQAVIQPAIKDKNNPFFKSKYADLSNIWDAIRKPLTDNELSVIQTSQIGVLVTILAHSSGEWVKSYYPINPTKDDPQGIGSAITYARRYALAAIAGASTEDDDGNEASMPNQGQGDSRKAYQPAGLASTVPVYTDTPAAPPVKSYPATDFSKLPFAYALPHTKAGYNMDQKRAVAKAHGARWNAEQKKWFAPEAIPELAEFLHMGASAPTLPMGQKAALSPNDDLPPWDMYDTASEPNV
jgi:hypothetical protein